MTTPHKYRHAPLAYVILQLVHPATTPITREQELALKEALREYVPLASRETLTHLDVAGNFDGAQPSTNVRHEEIVKFTSRDRGTSVTFAPQALTVETTRYDTWPQLRKLAELALKSRMDISPADGVERIGLRYIDELRIPNVVKPDWRDWVDPQLAPPALTVSPGTLQPQQQQSVVQYETVRPGVLVVLRYGAVNGPSAVQGLPLTRPSMANAGPFFLIDTDASWTPAAGDEVPAVDLDSVLTEADVLHNYVKDLFEASLTDRLRTEVLDAE